MAFSTRIVRVSDGWVLDGPVWLQEPPPKGNLEWSDVSQNPGYADYAAGIQSSELRAWHDRDRHFAFEGVYAYSGWVPIMTAKVQELERILAETADEAEFTIVRYEWESDLND
jgi:hypothetical protein